MRNQQEDKSTDSIRQQMGMQRYVGKLRDLYQQGHVDIIRLLPYAGVRFSLETCAEKLYLANEMGGRNSGGKQRLHPGGRYAGIISKEIDDLDLRVAELSCEAAIAFDVVCGVGCDNYGLIHDILDDERNEALSDMMIAYRRAAYEANEYLDKRGIKDNRVKKTTVCKPPTSYIGNRYMEDNPELKIHWSCDNFSVCPFCRIRRLTDMLSSHTKKVGKKLVIEDPKLDLFKHFIPADPEEKGERIPLLKKEYLFDDISELPMIRKKFNKWRDRLKRYDYIEGTRISNVDMEMIGGKLRYAFKEILISDYLKGNAAASFSSINTRVYKHVTMTAIEALKYVFGFPVWNFLMPEIYVNLANIRKLQRFSIFGNFL